MSESDVVLGLAANSVPIRTLIYIEEGTVNYNLPIQAAGSIFPVNAIGGGLGNTIELDVKLATVARTSTRA